MLIRDERGLQAVVDKLMGRSEFSFDFETSGLDYVNGVPYGIALAWEDDYGDIESHYIAFAHTETTNDTGERYAQWINEDGEVVDVDLDAQSSKLVEYISLPVAANILAPLFAQEDVTAHGWNVKFDKHFLYRLGVHEHNVTFTDGPLALWFIDENSEESKGLKYQTKAKLNIEMPDYKSMAYYLDRNPEEFLSVHIDDAARYAALDAECTQRLWYKLEQRLEDEGLLKQYYYLGCRLIPVLCEMEEEGLTIDIPETAKLRDELNQKNTELRNKITEVGYEMFRNPTIDCSPWYVTKGRVKNILSAYREDEYEIEDDYIVINGVRVDKQMVKTDKGNMVPRYPIFNPESADQVSRFLFEHLELPVPQIKGALSPKTGKPSVSKDVLVALKHELGDEAPDVIDWMLERRKYTKLISTYLTPMVNSGGKLHSTFNQHITKTGRLSSNSPNLQNIPSRGPLGKAMRKLCVAPEGYTMVVADYSALELRLLCHYSEDSNMEKAFRDNLDLHTYTGSLQSGVPYDELKRRIDEEDDEALLIRALGKTANFALNYAVGAKKYKTFLLVNVGVDLSLEEVQHQIDSYNAAYPELTMWKHRVIEDARRDGYVTTMGNRKRRLPDIYSRDYLTAMSAERQAVNVMAQGSAADIMAIVMPDIQDSLKEIGGTIIAQVHDEIVTIAPTEHVEEAKQRLEHHMTFRPNKYMYVPLVAEAKSGRNWSEAK